MAAAVRPEAGSHWHPTGTPKADLAASASMALAWPTSHAACEPDYRGREGVAARDGRRGPLLLYQEGGWIGDGWPFRLGGAAMLETGQGGLCAPLDGARRDAPMVVAASDRRQIASR